MYPSVRLYYPGGKVGSFGALAEGYLHAFNALDVEHAAFDYNFAPDEDGFPFGGSTHDIGLYVGEPTHLELMQMHARHKVRYVVLAPNGYGIPAWVVKGCKSYDVTPLAPSAWASEVLAKQFGHPVEVAPHGVHVQPADWDGPDSAETILGWAKIIERGVAPLRLLHVTSTASDRKGTLTLLRAMDEEGLCDMVELRIKCDPLVAPRLQDIVSDMPERCQRRIYIDTENYPNDGRYHAFLRGWDAVIQPSRAEGFGLVPLEAASIGLPSVLTCNTGHEDFILDIWSHVVQEEEVKDEEAVGWTVGWLGLASIPGEPFPVRPLSARSIAIAVRELRANLVRDMQKAIDIAPQVREKWAWKKVVDTWLTSKAGFASKT
jgi:glycosyltransferase involved in cell wall biosynthesis